VDAVADAAGAGAREKILSRNGKLTSGEVTKLADIAKQGAPEGNKRAAKQRGQSDHSEKTANRLAKQQKVGEKSVRRSGNYANAIDTIAEAAGSIAVEQILNQNGNFSSGELT